jgi:3-phytase
MFESNNNRIITFLWKGVAASLMLLSCNSKSSQTAETPKADTALEIVVEQPLIISDTVENDTDDPAIWINPQDPAQSIVIGTDKNEKGGLYSFDMAGKIIAGKTIKGLQRPNNVDLEYGLMLKGKPTDIAVVTERLTHKLRIFSVPDMKAVDNGGIPVFSGDTTTGYRDLMGIALFKSGKGKIYAIVGRKTGPTDGHYLWQYELSDNGNGAVKATLVRKFGQYSGKNEIESIYVDDVLGYVYYSDEGTGVRKYYADPDKGDAELALFATTGFAQDHEGISMYATSDSTGFILVSDQQAQAFQIFPREGISTNVHAHPLLRKVKVAALESDGSEMIALPINAQFKNGLFVAMSADKTFHYYLPETILGPLLNKTNQ